MDLQQLRYQMKCIERETRNVQDACFRLDKDNKDAVKQKLIEILRQTSFLEKINELTEATK